MSGRGLVLEIKGKEAVVLTPSGEFRRVKLPAPLPQVGEEINLPGASRQPMLQWAAAAVVLVAVSAAALGALLPGRQGEVPLPTSGSGKPVLTIPETVPVRYVTIDINPSLEMGLDQTDQVLSARAWNDDGQRLVDSLTLVGKPVLQAVEEVAREAMQEGYLKEGTPSNTVVITVTGDTGGQKGEQLRQRMEKTLAARQVEAAVENISVDDQMREKAAQAGLSAGKYAIWLQAVEEGLAVDPTKLRQESIAKAIREAGGNLGEVVGKAHQQQEFHRLEEKVKDKWEKALKEREDQPAEADEDRDDRDHPAGGIKESGQRLKQPDPREKERAEKESERLKEKRERAEEERKRAEQDRKRAEEKRGKAERERGWTENGEQRQEGLPIMRPQEPRTSPSSAEPSDHDAEDEKQDSGEEDSKESLDSDAEDDMRDSDAEDSATGETTDQLRDLSEQMGKG